MTLFYPTLVAEDGVTKIRSTALGNNTAQYSTAHIGTLVKLGTASNYVLAADGDEFDGIVHSVEAWTVNDGYSFGSVKLNGRIKVLKGNLAVGNFALAGVQTLGATPTGGVAKAGTATTHKWQCIYVDSTHAILEKI